MRPAGPSRFASPAWRPDLSLTLLALLLTPLADEGGDPSVSSSEAEEAGLEVVVSDQRVQGVEPLDTSASVTVIELDEAVSGSMDVAQVVEQASGTTVVRLGGLGDWSGVSIRGSSFRQVQVYLDGVPLNPDGSAAVNLSELPLGAFSRVEVWRGNAPPRFGSLPIGGVINLVTGEDMPPRLHASVGQLGTFRVGGNASSSGRILGRDSDALILVEGFRTRADFAYFSDNGTTYSLFDDTWRVRERNDKAQLSLTGRWRLELGSGSLTLLDSFLDRDEAIAGHIHGGEHNVALRTTRNLASLELARGGAWSRSESRLWHQRRLEFYDDRSGAIGVGSQLQRTQLDQLGALHSQRFLVSDRLVPGFTASARVDRHQVEDELIDELSDPAWRTQLSGSAHADVHLAQDRLTISPVLGGLWLDSRKLGAVPFEDTPVAPESRVAQGAFTPRLGLLLRPTAWLALKANGGRYLRPPDFTELFGDRGTVIGNSELVPESGWQWDVGARVVAPENRFAQASLDVTQFYVVSRDRIVLVQNSQRTSVPQNLGKAWVQGLETALALDLFGVLDSSTSYTWTLSWNRVADPAYANNQLPRIPEHELHQRTSLHWGERVRVGHGFSHTSGSYWDTTNWYLSTPRRFHDVFLRLQPQPGWPSAELSVLNLLDNTTEVVPRNRLDDEDEGWIVQPVTDFAGYPLPGRTWMITLRWEPSKEKNP